MLKFSKSKLIFFILLINIFLISNLISACQYTDIESYQEDIEIFYHNDKEFGRNIDLEGLIIVELIGGDIRVSNNLEVPITLNITYHRLSKWYGFDDYRTREAFTVGPNDFGEFTNPHISEIVNVKYVEPNIISSEIKSISKNRQICKICPNGEECFDDGVSCSLDIECGAGVCNTGDKCGKFNGICPDGKVLKNNLCVDSFLKNLKKNWIWVLSICFILFIYLTQIIKNKIKKTELIKHEREKIKEERIKIKEEKELIKKKEESAEVLNSKIKKLRLKLKNAKGNIKIKLEKEMKSQGKLQKNKLEEINNEKSKIRDRIIELNILIHNLKDSETIYENERKRPRKIKKYINGHYYLDGEGYPCFFNKGNRNPYSENRIHNFIYGKETGDIIDIGEEIHHIDSNPENYDINNLIKLTRRDHSKINHVNIKRGDYDAGINELKKNGIRIPKRIKRFIN